MQAKAHGGLAGDGSLAAQVEPLCLQGQEQVQAVRHSSLSLHAYKPGLSSDSAPVGCCNSWDTNKDGKLSPREFAKGLESALGVSSTEAWDMVDAMMPRMDIDGDGNLSYKEFLNTFRMSAVTSKLADKMRRA